MVARDDLTDGGAAHMAAIVRTLRTQCPGVTIEVLTSDFAGNTQALDTLLQEKPDVFNHNIETVRALTPRVRHRATYDQTLRILQYAANTHAIAFIKSGLMVGLGETQEEVKQTLDDLHAVGCNIVTIGQYLQSDRRKLLVKEFIPPAQFTFYQQYGNAIGIKQMYCGPFVRSSYNAHEIKLLAE